ncbi:hypothetical protein [Fibrobacter sp.]|uniref:hypothetical protein n=1 Tax=Fibrobacter sp. TaxID=35828 RepID=UPI0038691A64
MFTGKNSIFKWCNFFGLLAVSAMFWACSDNVAGGASGDAGVVAIKDRDIAGVTQKGPFVTGSAVTVQELDGITLKQTGKSFKGTIKSDKGDFAIKDINLQSQYAILEANGYYRDEISGKKSSGTVTLRALTDLSDRKTVNINLLTHLEYERVKYLVTEKKKSIADAKAQADEEILAAFGIEGNFGNPEDLNIFESGDGNAALLAVSVLMQSDVDVAGLTERMGEFSIALAEGGSWDDVDTKTAIADWACDVDLKGTLANVRKNVESWKYADSVPSFEKYVTNFWWDNYGLGVCNAKRENETKRNVNKLSKLYNEYFVCEKGRWVIPGEEPQSSSSSWSGGTSSFGERSSSSIYDPFVSSSSSEPEDTIPPLPVELDFFDSTYSFDGYRSFGEGKQEVWFLISPGRLVNDRERRDSIASALVNLMGTRGFAFEGTINNDSLDNVRCDTLSYVYSLKKENVVYKISITKELGLGIMYGSSYFFKVKVVVLKDGFEEMPTTDYSSLRFFRDFPEELAFMEDYSSTKVRADYDDDSLMISWQFRRNVDSTSSQMYQFLPDLSKEKKAEEALKPLLEVLPDNGFTFVKSDSLGRNSNMSDSVVVRYFYEMETPAARFMLRAEVGTVGYPYFGVTYTFKYGYTVDVYVYYKQKPERKGRSE